MSTTKEKISKEELEFKAEAWHKVWVADKVKAGFHAPAYHADPCLYPPARLRGDGKTYCDKCHVSMVDYAQLPEATKASDRAIVLNQDAVEAAWQEHAKKVHRK